MSTLQQLLDAAKAVSPQCSVKFQCTDTEDRFVCLVVVGGVVLFESKPGTLDEILEETSKKLKSVSQRMHAVLGNANLGDDASKKPST